jgi:hypothetical protein
VARRLSILAGLSVSGLAGLSSSLFDRQVPECLAPCLSDRHANIWAFLHAADCLANGIWYMGILGLDMGLSRAHN